MIDILEKAFKKVPTVLENGRRIRGEQSEMKKWNQRNELVTILLGDDPQLIVNSLLDALSQGANKEELASIVTYAAALRIDQFHTRNEFSDWDT